MATDLRNITANLQNDTDFRAWVTEMTAALTAAGLTLYSTTNNIDPATVTRPAANGFATGAQIWRFNDTLQGTLPIFIRIAYGCGATTSVPKPLFQFGTTATTDASVAVGGQTFNPPQSGPNSSGPVSSGKLPCYTCYDGHTLVMVAGIDTSAGSKSYNWVLWVERPIVDGARTGTAIMIRTSGPVSTTEGYTILPASGAVPGNLGAGATGPLPPQTAANHAAMSSQAGANTTLIPAVISVLGKVGICNGLMSYKGTNMTAYSSVTVTAEASATYMPLNAAHATFDKLNYSGDNTTPVAMRWQ